MGVNSSPQIPQQEPIENRMHDVATSARTTLKEDLGFGKVVFEAQVIDEKNTLDTILGNLEHSISTEDFVGRLKTNVRCSQSRIDQILKNADVASYLKLQRELLQS